MSAPENRKATAGEQVAFQNASNNADDTRPHNLKQRGKRLIIGVCCWGFISPRFASWVIERLRLDAEAHGAAGQKP